MDSIWLIAILLFISVTYLFWKFTNAYFKKQNGTKMWQKWGTRLFYWQGVIYTGTGITILLLYALKWTNVLTF